MEDSLGDNILKSHNVLTYEEIKNLFDEGAKRVGLIQAQGTGKSFIALKWLFDECIFDENKYGLYLAPRYTILEQFRNSCYQVAESLAIPKETVDEKIILAHYDNLSKLSSEQLKQVSFDCIVADEFHGIGAPIRTKTFNDLMNIYSDAKILGLTATPIRQFDGGRNMATELFGDNIVKGITLSEAIQDNILPTPKYVIALYTYDKITNSLQERINKVKDPKVKMELQNKLSEIKKQIENALNLPQIMERNLKSDGKYLIFCQNVEHLNTVKKKIESGELFDGVNKNVKTYSATYIDSVESTIQNVHDFENDNSQDTLKVMLSIDIFNEGLHINGLDGVIMFRPTESNRLYLQQLGRALDAGNEKQPLILDLVSNWSSYDDIQYMFETDKNDRLEEGIIQRQKEDIPFKIEEMNLELNNMIRIFDEKVNISYQIPTETMLLLLQKFVDKNGDLNVPSSYRDPETQIKIGSWLKNQINSLKRYARERGINEDDEEFIELAKTGKTRSELYKMDNSYYKYNKKFNPEDYYDDILSCAERYCDKNKSLKMGSKTVVQTETGKKINLGSWIYRIKTGLAYAKNNPGENENKYLPPYDKDFIDKLVAIDPQTFATKAENNNSRFENIKKYAKIYYDKKENLNIPKDFDVKLENGEIFRLGIQIYQMRRYFNFLKHRKDGEPKPRTLVAYPQELLDELLKMDSKFLDYSQIQRKVDSENEILWAVKEFYSDPKNVNEPITNSNKTKLPSGKILNLGQKMEEIRSIVKKTNENKNSRKKVTKYSEQLIDELLKIKPDIFELADKKLNEVQQNNLKLYETILTLLKNYYNGEGKGTLQMKTSHKIENEDGSYFPLGKHLANIKHYVTARKRNAEYKGKTYPDEMIKEIIEMDPDIFKTKEELHKELEDKLLLYAQEYYGKTGSLRDMSSDFSVKEPNGKKFKLGSMIYFLKKLLECRASKKEYKGNYTFSDEIIKLLLEIDPTLASSPSEFS